MGSGMRMSLACGLVLFVCAAAASANDPNQMYRQLFGEEDRAVSASSSRADDAAFAQKLLKAAGGMADSPKLQQILYERAYESGVKSKDGYATAADAIRELAAAVPARKAECDEKLLKLLELQLRSADVNDAPVAARHLMDHLVAMAEAETAGHRFPDAASHYRRAYSLASQQKLPEAETLGEQLKGAVAREKVEAEIAACEKVVAANPANELATRRLLLLYLTERDDPKKAAELLPRAVCDESTRTLLPLVNKDMRELAEGACLDLGGWYASLAAKAGPAGRPKMLLRSKGYYERYLDLHAKNDGPAYQARMQLERVTKELDRYGSPGGAAGRSAVAKGKASLVADEALLAWAKDRDAMPVPQQVEALQKKLSEVNGTGRQLITSYKEKNGQIVSLTSAETSELVSLTPLVGMQLDELRVRKAGIANLAILKGMKLREVDFSSCQSLTDFSVLEGMPLARLSLDDCLIAGLPSLKGMTLNSISVRGCKSLASLKGLEGAQVGRIDADNTAIRDLVPLKGTGLTSLRLIHCKNLTSLKGIEGLPLVELNVGGCPIASLEPVRGMKLTKLEGGECTGVRDISPLQGMPLTEVVLNGLPITTLEPLRGTRLRSLSISRCIRLRDFSVVRESLAGDLGFCEMPVTSFECLRGMKITRLSAKDCPNLTSLAGLEGMQLTSLAVSGCKNLAGTKGIEGLPLEYLDLRGTRLTALSIATDLRKKIPTLKTIEQ